MEDILKMYQIHLQTAITAHRDIKHTLWLSMLAGNVSLLKWLKMSVKCIRMIYKLRRKLSQVNTLISVFKTRSLGIYQVAYYKEILIEGLKALNKPL